MTFLCFLVVSLLTAVGGERSCSCFGALKASPWIAAAIDFTASIALLLCKPGANTSANTFSPSWLAFLVVYLVALLALPIALAVSGDPSSPLLLPSKQAVVLGVLSPGEWRNSSLSLTDEGTVPVEIETITSTCPCLSLKYVPRVVPPSGTTQMIAILDLGKEPNSVGKLRIRAQGRTRFGALAFSVQVTANVQEAANRTQCMNNLRQISLATQNLHDANGQLPSTEGAFPGMDLINFGPITFWLLPYLEQQAVYDLALQNGAYNSGNADRTYVIKTYLCPSDPSQGSNQSHDGWALCSYAANALAFRVESGEIYRLAAPGLTAKVSEAATSEPD